MGSADDDDTWRRRRPRSDDAHLTDSERRRHYQAHPPGTPVVRTDDEIEPERAGDRRRGPATRTRPRGIPAAVTDNETDPFGIALALDSSPDERDVAALRRMGRDTESPIRTIEFAQALRLVTVQLKEAMRRERVSALESQTAELRDLLDRPPKEVASKIEQEIVELKATVKELVDFTGGQKRVLRWIGGGIVSAVLAIAGFLYWRGVLEGSTKVRMEQIEREQERLLRKIDGERRYDVTPMPTPNKVTP